MDQALHSSSVSGASAVARGVSRLFLRNQIVVQPEVSLRNNRRADLMGLSNKGEIIIVEIKCSRADLLGDQKWPEYLEYCDRFFWAVPAGFDISPLQNAAFMPERAGVIMADAYDAEIARQAALVPLAPARRKTETQRLARLAMRRLMGISDPDSALSEFEFE
ncbi:MAG: MmcB family DNA repair protein [Sphingomonadaceae bacterium]|uniref:MmcB family DNA repair protein n=1 Tax=Sphingorhabdus sp. TaxID=1902408 RepID=UPI002FDB5914|nr:MmcB family DNA repair protein [Sphingomonadaceae bacterium]